MKKVLVLVITSIILFGCGKSKDEIRNEFVNDSLRNVFVVDSLLRLDTIKTHIIDNKVVYNNGVIGDSIVWSYDSNDSVTNVKCYNNGAIKSVDTYYRDSIGNIIRLNISDKLTYIEYDLTYEFDTINNIKIEVLKNSATKDLLRKTIFTYDSNNIILSKTTVHPIYGALTTIKYKIESGVVVSDIEDNLLFKNNGPINHSEYMYDSIGNLINLTTFNYVYKTKKIIKYKYVDNRLVNKTTAHNGDTESIDIRYHVRYYYKNSGGNIVKL